MKYFGLWLLCGVIYTWLNRKKLKEEVIGVNGITPLVAYFVTTLFWLPLIVTYLIKKVKKK
jgi:hypothetical protein